MSAPTGVIVGGWPYVWAAYGLSGAILVGYAASIYWRFRAEKRRQQGNVHP